MAPPPRALTIAGSDSGGGAGAQADLKTFLACKVHGMSALTAVTVQNSLGVSAVHEIPAAIVAAQIESVATDIGVGATKTGMLASAPIIEAIAEVIDRVDVGPFVVDPVCASQHGDPLLTPEALDAMKTLLFPRATLITPNLNEVRLLIGLDVVDRAGMEQAARVLKDFGPQWVLVKGGHLPSGDAVDLLFDGESFTEFRAPRHETAHTHGSGDTLASATTAALACGASLPDAVAEGKRFVTGAVADSFAIGSGLGPVGHFWRIKDWPEPA
ncbi:MAG: bifunctional hydroxymethylpyrimidine kinase/phosphomethylpyrimidine kinase [Jatrophihabitans sp.]|uniref:bifunctional hydroxymethylpyrimidine kinase/phosphomethylpyrimidine kinase n=1 Tax=Jatrophihabitans sp. TaxID=1932789 RepID=UPI003F7CD49C